MKSLLMLGCGLLLAAGVAVGQQNASGTVNDMSINPYQNQQMTNTMGSTTGQNTELQGEQNLPNGLVPNTTVMLGSGSNGSMNQSVVNGQKGTKGAATAGTRAGRSNSQNSKAKARHQPPPQQ